MSNVAKFFIIIGSISMILGIKFLILPKIHFFKLPGDIVIRRENLVLILPISASIIISTVLTLILNLIFRK